MNRLKEYYDKIPDFLKNKFAVTLILFFIWMLFFDKNDIISQVKLKMQVNELHAKKEYYRERIEEVNADKEKLFTNPENLERFARERYWMKRDNEDIFIIVEK